MRNAGILLLLLAAATVPAAADKPKIRLGGVSVGVGYAHYAGPYRYYYPAFYSPFWGPFDSFYYPYTFYHPLYATGFLQGPNMGEIRLQAEKTSEVYLDGAYAGTAADPKSIWLEPGAYNFEVKQGDRPVLSRRIYVLSGKRLKLATEEKR